MIRLRREVQPRDFINALAGTSVSLDRILLSGNINPSELCRIQLVAESLLALRQNIDVKQASDVEQAERVSAALLSLAMRVIEESRRQMRKDTPLECDLQNLLDVYSDTVEAALHMIGLVDRALEPQFRLALRWTTP